jgi:hypothetical protein
MKKYIKFEDGEYFRLVDISFDEFINSNLWDKRLKNNDPEYEHYEAHKAYKEYKRANNMFEFDDFEIQEFNYKIAIIYDIDELEPLPADITSIHDLYSYYQKLSKIKPVINISD